MRHVRHLLQEIWQAYSGEAAWQVVADLSRYHRIQASPGYRQAARYLHGRLAQDGIAAEILSYPADERTQFWGWPGFQEWSCTDAVLRLVAPEDHAERLADFRGCAISIIQRSAPFEGEAEVVLLEDGENEADYQGVDVAGKVVLTRGEVRRVWELAVQRRGAIGLLFDGMRTIPSVRVEGDLADARQYTSFWWHPGDTRCFGFVLTPRQGQALRRLLKAGQAPVRVWAKVNSHLYDGAFEIVSAAIPGSSQGEILVVAHLCHPQPSANDNASGAAASCEAARALHVLLARGQLPPPQRTIRFLWLPEMTGTFAYLAGREAELHRLIAGINLDMVGEDQGQTGSSWIIETPPAAAASFAPDLLARLRADLPSLKGVPDVSPSHSRQEAYPLYRQTETPFSGGSDHEVLSDPSVGIPTPMLIQWPDRFYHTSADTPDRTDPHSLHRAGTLAAAYAYWLSVAGPTETMWLGYEMVARFKADVAGKGQQAITTALTDPGANEQTLADALACLDRELAYLLGRHKQALSTLERLGPVDCLIGALAHEAETSVRQELAWAIKGVELYAAQLDLRALPEPRGPRELTELEREAARCTPVRRVRGPISLGHHLSRLSPEEREQWRELARSRAAELSYTVMHLVLYWADGARSILEIADLVEMETGHWDVEFIFNYFHLLEKLDLLTLS